MCSSDLVRGEVILYADKRTDSINRTIDETDRRRKVQEEYNALHGITPTTISKKITSLHDSIWESDYVTVPRSDQLAEPDVPAHEIPVFIKALRSEMKAAAKDLEFERAAELRDRINDLEERRLRLG